MSSSETAEPSRVLRGLSQGLSRPGGGRMPKAVDAEPSLRALPRGLHAAGRPSSGSSKPGGGRTAAIGVTYCAAKVICQKEVRAYGSKRASRLRYSVL